MLLLLFIVPPTVTLAMEYNTIVCHAGDQELSHTILTRRPRVAEPYNIFAYSLAKLTETT